ncbi:MAG: lamin tail domain-containing protein, partial [Pseudomonadota bacterium]
MQPVTRLARPSRFAAAALVASMYFSGSAALAQDLVISGVIDGPLTGGTPKAVEIYVINDVADLSVYGLGSANNGGGSDGEEFTFPAAAASAGQYLYVASEAPQFTAFFGAAPDYTSSAASINGDDAIELFQNGSVIDVFGDIDVDGTGQPWDHVDGWAYRVSDTGPDGATFVLANWSFSGPNALDGETSNATAATPFPAGTFTTAGGDAAPRVRATIPADGAGNVAVDADIEIVFSEPVTATEPWFDLSCSASLGRTATPSSADNVTFTLSVDGDFDTGESCSLTILAAGIADIDSDDPPDNPAADIVIGFDIETGLPAPVVINEIHADPDTAEGDANRDGAANFSDDEFVEIVNVSGADLDVGGWTLADGVSVRHTFPAGTVIDAGCAIVVFGGGTPAGAFGGAAVQTASSGALGLNNGGDTVTVSDGAADVASVGYGGEGGNNQALTRNPDLSGAFEQHLGVSGTRYSPGTEAGGGAFAGCTFVIPLVAIHDLQGVGDATPLAGQSVRIEGVVTGDFQDNDADTDNNLRGFYVQQQQPDGDPLTVTEAT